MSVRVRHVPPLSFFGSIAQLVEQGILNPEVVGSIPTGATISSLLTLGWIFLYRLRVKDYFFVLFLGVALFGLYLYDRNRPHDTELSRYNDSVRKVSYALASKTNGVLDWQRVLPQGVLYTVDLQHAFFRVDARPLVTEIRVTDVLVNDDGSFLVKAVDCSSGGFGGEICYLLRCDLETARAIEIDKSSSWSASIRGNSVEHLVPPTDDGEFQVQGVLLGVAKDPIYTGSM